MKCPIPLEPYCMGAGTDVNIRKYGPVMNHNSKSWFLFSEEIPISSLKEGSLYGCQYGGLQLIFSFHKDEALSGEWVKSHKEE